MKGVLLWGLDIKTSRAVFWRIFLVYLSMDLSVFFAYFLFACGFVVCSRISEPFK